MKNNKQLSRLLTILLTLTMVFTSMGLAAFADETDGSGSADAEVAAEVQDVAADAEGTDGTGDTTEQGNGTEELVDPVDPVDPVTVSAPAVVATTKAMNISFTWNAQDVEGIKYALEVVSEADGVLSDPVVYDGIEATTYDLTVKKYSTTYHFRVGAYVNAVEEAVWSETIDYLTPDKLTKPTGVKFGKIPTQKIAEATKNLRSDNQVTLYWTAPASGTVDHYAIYMGNINGKKFKLLKDKIKASATSYTFRAASGDHTFKVRAYWKEDKSVYVDSSNVKLKGIKKYLNKVNDAAYWKVTFKKSATIFKSSTGTAKVKTVKKGTKAQAIGKYPKTIHGWDVPRRVQVKLSDGTVGWALWGSIKISLDINVKTDYPVTVKEAYVKNFTSSTSYLVWVNEYTQRVNIFKGKKGSWKLIRSNRVTTGRFAQPISRGTKSKYKLGNKINGGGRVYRLNDKGRSYFFIKARGFHGSGYFHTRCWWTDSGRPRNGITTQPSTRGCIRMYTPDASYVLNMPRNSRVILK